MLRVRAFVIVFAVAALSGYAGRTNAAPLPMMDSERGVLTIAPLLETVTPGVVNISVRAHVPAQQSPLLQDPFFRRFFGVPDQQPERQVMAAGSGVIVDAEKGYVLTNNHVIEHADDIVVTLKDGRQFKAKLIGTDPETDVALVKIDAKNLTAVPFGNSDNLKVGDVVIAIGNPFGIGQTVTSGIVSALGRSGLGIEGYEDFIQTDASINPGNSGGALVNSKGKLIGINTAIIGPGGGNVGIGFAVPSNMVRAVMLQLARYGEVRRGQLGIAIQDLTPSIAGALGLTQTNGAIITNVEPNSPAARKGIQAGDVVIAVDGVPVRNSAHLRNRIGLVPKGQKITLDLLRNGKRHKIAVEVGTVKAAELPGDKAIPEFAGAEFRDIPADHPLAKKLQGVLVASVEPGSPAWQSGLREKDAIIAVNRKPVPSLNEFSRIVKNAGSVIAMNVVRHGTSLFLVIER